MNLYVIEAKDDFVDYDCYVGFVIRAETEDRCRVIAGEHAADEGSEVWKNPKNHTLKLIGMALEGDIEEIIILDSFNAG